MLPTPHAVRAIASIGVLPIMECTKLTVFSSGGTIAIVGPKRAANHAATCDEQCEMSRSATRAGTSAARVEAASKSGLACHDGRQNRGDKLDMSAREVQPYRSTARWRLITLPF